MADEFEQGRRRMPRDADEVRDLVPGAAQERDRTQTERDRLAIELASRRGPRDASWQYAATEPPEARGSLVGFYTLVAIVVLVLSVLAGVYLTRRPNPQAALTFDHASPSMPPIASPVPGGQPLAGVSTASPTASTSSNAAPVAPAGPPAPAAPPTPIYAVPPASTPLPIVPSDAPSQAPSDTNMGTGSGTNTPPADGGTTTNSSGTGTVTPDGGTAAPSDAPAASTPVAPTVGP